MNFVGSGKTVTYLDFLSLSLQFNFTVPEIRAIVQVESATDGFDAQNRPTILFEPHIFWRELGPGPKRDRAAALGLAYANWRDKPYPRTSTDRYEQLRKSMLIDETAALRSASYGLGQIMGFNCRAAGFSTPQGLFAAMLVGEREQIVAMLTWIVNTRGLAQALREHRWADLARGYNGSGYAANHYDTKLASAYRSFVLHPDAGFNDMDTNLDPILRLGSNGPFVVEAQTRLVAHGYDIGPKGIDGGYGTDVKKAVMAFQLAHPNTGLVDGVVGENTWAALRSDTPQTVEHVTPPAPGLEIEVPPPVVATPAVPGHVGVDIAGAVVVAIVVAVIAVIGFSWGKIKAVFQKIFNRNKDKSNG